MVSRRRKWTLLFALAMLPISSFAGSCTLWSDYSDGLTCGKDEDCFRAQGEVCDQMIKECVAGPQARLPAPHVAAPVTSTMAATVLSVPVDEQVEITDDVSLQAQQVQP